MKRRSFLQLAGLAATAVALPKSLFARNETHQPDLWKNLSSVEGFKALRTANPKTKPIFKIVAVNNRVGVESRAHSVEANEHGYLVFPEIKNVYAVDVVSVPVILSHQVPTTSYALYAPMHGFERTGPWYLLKTYTRREVQQARFTIAAPDYMDNHLFPRFMPWPDDHCVTLDLSHMPVMEGQTHWRVYAGENPKGPAPIIVEV